MLSTKLMKTVSKYPKSSLILLVIIIFLIYRYINNNTCYFYNYGCGCPIYPTGSTTSISHAVPKCTHSCFTTSKDKNAFKSCTNYCGSYKNPALVNLPKCDLKVWADLREIIWDGVTNYNNC